ncbi:MAG: PHP domain-containing protein [Clostridiales bacterium]|nr:PHP domain-containing protein [Clostridiales bacterium]
MAPDLTDRLNDKDPERRLEALTALRGVPRGPQAPGHVNNHIHTMYSFSPYSPSAAVFEACRAGLTTAGIMDHDSIAGGEEFIAAGRVMGLPVTCGIECRVSFADTPFSGRLINNPDQKGVVYMALHGVPTGQHVAVQRFFEPLREARGRRNRRMTERIHDIVSPLGIGLDYERDVLPLSWSACGGAVTERHILFGLAHNIIAAIGRGEPLIEFIDKRLELPLSGKARAYLADTENPGYAYDLLNVLKGQFVSRFYIPATDECPPVREVLDLSERVGAISAYAYLGDVGDSPTGDKKAQKFEDDYLDDLFGYLRDIGFRAVTYMPTRNTGPQLTRVRELCRRMGLFEICGEDINQPRQSFVTEKLRDPGFSHLVDATWALIAHEKLADEDPARGFFADAAVREYPDIARRAAAFAQRGRALAR